MKLFSQSHQYSDNWSIVALAFFLRYPNPYASHVLSCDVIARDFTPSGSLRTTRLILKRGALPSWFPSGIVSRQESWIVEESEVDIAGRVVQCVTRNLDHVKVMQVIEATSLTESPDGLGTVQHTEARFLSRFGWGLTRRIEQFGATRFKANIERSREGISLVLRLLREAHQSRLTLGPTAVPSLASRLDFSQALSNVGRSPRSLSMSDLQDLKNLHSTSPRPEN
ncbi:MSF1-domain-containing protein [Auriculariales sp. MPI-PUGE-AT-0066]|nr:MSF1-domain-containing protein [Auriculariales sp. MPI-PUGE-AT-0066]